MMSYGSGANSGSFGVAREHEVQLGGAHAEQAHAIEVRADPVDHADRSGAWRARCDQRARGRPAARAGARSSASTRRSSDRAQSSVSRHASPWFGTNSNSVPSVRRLAALRRGTRARRRAAATPRKVSRARRGTCRPRTRARAFLDHAEQLEHEAIAVDDAAVALIGARQRAARSGVSAGTSRSAANALPASCRAGRPRRRRSRIARSSAASKPSAHSAS